MPNKTPPLLPRYCIVYEEGISLFRTGSGSTCAPSCNHQRNQYTSFHMLHHMLAARVFEFADVRRHQLPQARRSGFSPTNTVLSQNRSGFCSGIVSKIYGSGPVCSGGITGFRDRVHRPWRRGGLSLNLNIHNCRIFAGESSTNLHILN